MKALSLAIDAHHALTPELRERIVENVRTRMQEHPYRLLAPEHLRALARSTRPALPSSASIYS